MKKRLQQLSCTASIGMYGFILLFCLPLLLQRVWVQKHSDSKVIGATFVPKIKSGFSNTQGSVACLDEVRVTLGPNCTFLVTPTLVAEFNRMECDPAGMELRITDKSGALISGNILRGVHAGQRLKYFLSHPICNPDGCWGSIIVEDKNMPRFDFIQFDTNAILCNQVNYVLNNPQTIGYTSRSNSPKQLIPGTIFSYTEAEDNVPNHGIVRFANCDPDCPISVKWFDKLETYGCDSLAKDGLYARILRTWVATNCVGKSIDTVQRIDVCRPEITDFGFNDTAKTATTEYNRVVVYPSCSPNKGLIRRIDVTPFAIKYRYRSSKDSIADTLFLDKDLCNYSMQIKDQEFSICDGRGLKIDRQIFIFDWCRKKVVDTLHVLIKIGDFEKPDIIKPSSNPDHIVELSTGPLNCEASIPVTAQGLKDVLGLTIKDNCKLANLSVKVKSKNLYSKGIIIGTKTDTEPWFEPSYPAVNGSLSGLNPGLHWVIINAADDCYNSVKDSVLIRVIDKIAPVMVVNNKLTISLSNGISGYAIACVGDINEGSSDNCFLSWMKVRRSIPESCFQNFIDKGYDTNDNGILDPLPADGDWTKADGFDYDGDGRLASFGETFVRADGKLFSPLGNCVDFFCCDVAAKVTVELWGEDRSGNRNFAWIDIVVEDKTAPRCTAPIDYTIKCSDKCLANIDNPKAATECFGDILIVSGNDCASLDTSYQVIKKLKCGAGTIERIWTVTKQTTKGLLTSSCKQVIKVLPIHEYTICFPKDAVQKACSVPLVDSVSWDELGCDLITVNVNDKRYNATGDECYKIFRTYTVLNWCAYDDKCGDPMQAGNVFVVERGIFNSNNDKPIYVLVRDKEKNGNERFWLSQDDILQETTDKEFTPPYCANAFSGSDLGLPVGEFYHSFMYTQIIKVFDEERPVVEIPQLDIIPTRATDCLADAIIPFKAKDDCTDKVVLERAQLMVAPFQTTNDNDMIPYSLTRWFVRESSGNSYQVTIRDLPAGKHDLIVVVRDECGNLSVPTRIPFEIKDQKAPAPICIQGLSTELMPDGSNNGMMTVWAKDFIASKIFDCNGQGPETENGLKLVTTYSINRMGDPAVKDQASLTFTCADAGITVNVEIHAWDEANNHDFCTTYVLVQDNGKRCPEGATYTGEISGLITTVDAEPIMGADIKLSGQMNQSQTSVSTGKFNFSRLQQGGDYTITPQLDKAPLNGVSTFDMVLIQKHILGTQLLKDPYQLIAADVNNSRTITTIDLIQVRKLVLGLESRFTSVPSWKFIPSTHKFSNASNPWQEEMKDVISVNDLKDKVKVDFIGIKMGDINGNATTNSLVIASPRSDQALHIKAQRLDQNTTQIKTGDIFTVALSSKELSAIQGYQFTLGFDAQALALDNIEYQSIKPENLAVFAQDGIITVSWYDSNRPANTEQGLMLLHFKAKANGHLPELVEINSRLTSAEAYTFQDETIGVELDWGQLYTQPTQPRLQQNTPNPFNEETSIEFSLPEASQATLNIHDLSGRLLYTIKRSFPQGTSRIPVKAADLQNNKGVLYYTLETTGFTATRKMIIIE